MSLLCVLNLQIRGKHVLLLRREKKSDYEYKKRTDPPFKKRKAAKSYLTDEHPIP